MFCACSLQPLSGLIWGSALLSVKLMPAVKAPISEL
jgi:hypothetical protein